MTYSIVRNDVYGYEKYEQFYKHFLIWHEIFIVMTKVVVIGGAIAMMVVVNFIFCFTLTGNDPATSIIAKVIICSNIVFIATTVIVFLVVHTLLDLMNNSSSAAQSKKVPFLNRCM